MAKSKVKLRFPNITQLITKSFRNLSKIIHYPKLFVLSFLSGLILLVIITQSILLFQNQQKAKQLLVEHQQIEQEITHWQTITAKYPNYRDVYLKLASLEYQIGDTQQAQNYLDQAFTIDPNTEEGRVLGEKISKPKSL